MSAFYALVRNPDTAAPFLGVVVFSGGFDYVVPKGTVEDGDYPSQEDLVDRYISSSGKEESDLTVDDYKEIATIPFNSQGSMVDVWLEHKNRSSAKKAVIETLKEYLGNASTAFSKTLQQAVEEAKDAGADYEDPDTGEDTVDSADIISSLLNNIDPDGPDGWRIKHLLEEFASTNEL